MYRIENNIAKIDGASGRYDGKINNKSVQYGRNSVSNMQGYLNDYTIKPENKPMPSINDIETLDDEEFEKRMSDIENYANGIDNWLNSLPPLQFEQRYMPNIKNHTPDKMALMGAAYEEMGQKTEISTEELTSTLQEAFGKEVSADALDLNSDKKIDLAEYSTSILLSDALSKKSIAPSIKNIDGTINNDGQNASIAYSNKKNYGIANQTFKAIYETFDLGAAQEDFKSSPNNMIS